MLDGDGDTLLTDTRMALCRCGRSGNKPLCDGSHAEIGFETG
ncbi:MAG: CDGSH iron-sulfur domain-containing protein [Bacteroidetes bacterium SW_7_64_58]|nr:MAG: CDGSH iron-sulfur domain-containing protein [Bacteroidetes bacterium SW_7_64_58]